MTNVSDEVSTKPMVSNRAREAADRLFSLEDVHSAIFEEYLDIAASFERDIRADEVRHHTAPDALSEQHQPVHEIVDFATTGKWLCEKCDKTWDWNTAPPAKCVTALATPASDHLHMSLGEQLDRELYDAANCPVHAATPAPSREG